MSYAARFRKPDGPQKYLAAYNAALALWPVSPEPIEIDTSYGTTYINAVGAPDAPPLVLLHGGQITSTQWYPNIAALSQHFRVYAPDIVDQMGRSTPKKHLKTREDSTSWLAEMMNALNIERAAFAGLSQGGWLALNMGLTAPERVDRLVLLSPADCFAPLSWKLTLRMMSVLIVPVRGMYYWCMQWMTTMPLKGGHPLIEQFIAGTKTFKPQEMLLPLHGVLPEAELRQLSVPTLLLIGEREVVYKYSPQAIVARAKALIPDLEVEMIPNGGHLFPVDQAEATNARMLSFLQRV